MTITPPRRGSVLVISGTGGAGKGTIVERIRRQHPDLWWSVSWATRAPRSGEIDGEHYWFRSRDDFLALRDANGFLEWADVYGVFKGTPVAALHDALEHGHDALLEMDIQGAINLVARIPDATVVFVVAPSLDDQAHRLRGRSTDSEADIQRRLDEASAEHQSAIAQGFHIVVNDDLDRATSEVAAILRDSRDAALRPHD